MVVGVLSVAQRHVATLQNESGTSGQCSRKSPVCAVRAIGLRPLCQSLGGLSQFTHVSLVLYGKVKKMCGQEKPIHTALAPFGYECPYLGWAPREAWPYCPHCILVGLFNVVANA